jgi:hypothetical protein
MPNNKLHNLYHSLNVVRVTKARKMAQEGHGHTRNAIKMFIVKHQGKRLLERRRRSLKAS